MADKSGSKKPPDSPVEKFIKQDDVVKMLEEQGIQNYEPQAVTHLLDYINDYTTEMLNQAVTLAKHAGRDNINLADVRLALNVEAAKSRPRRLSTKELRELAREHNKSQLPEYFSAPGVALPTDGCVLTNYNYRLRPIPTVPNQLPLMDMTNRQNQIVAFTTVKGHTPGVSTIIRTSTDSIPVNIPLNLPPQRIILKPQIPSQNGAIYPNQSVKMDDNNKKKMRFE